MADGAGLKAKIAALRAKTTRAGCTEAEALAAAALAARLMVEHALSEADLTMDEALIPERTSRATWRTDIAGSICLCTNTTGVMIGGEGFAFIGRAPGPDVAVYLYALLTRAIRAEIVAFKTGTFYRRRRSLATRRQAVNDLTLGLVARLGQRLKAMFAPTISPERLLESRCAKEERYPVTRPLQTGASRQPRFNEALSTGFKAGSAIPIHHGVAAHSGPGKPPVPAPAPRLAAPSAQGRLF